MMQNQLMSKLATIDHDKKPSDELGFSLHPVYEEPDALLSLLSKSKDIVRTPLCRPDRTPSRSNTSKRHSRGSRPNSRKKTKELF
jgi:hypothetical protein